ncbi:glutamate ABC transporter substrate-binding protein [Streptomyces calidiresistens]|uniref:Transporter substrate-binding domain-containing protein n=1 Tax=Streptomyces calidiresistens TaxID=1485586 RepID=A0A7W3T101_9ACTN|nr:glutamate ABC transporter substrate-binding protein [Streptomyces calidiresistens]MBB0228910.1 transporter substrate-binding domain-containing protein [Streptomyces calidiresistens]
MRIRKATALAATVLALSLTATACGTEDSGNNDNGGAASDNGGSDGGDAGSGGEGLTIGIKFDQPGLGLLTPDGEYKGLDVDVATYIANELGVEAADIEWLEAPSPERENLIMRGDVDLVVATYSITDARKESISFAGPYFVAHQDLLIRVDDEVAGEDDINDLTLCSVTGSTSAQRVKDEVAPDAALHEFGTYSECLAGLENGTVDALTTDDAILAGYAAQPEHEGKFKLAGLNLSDEYYGVGLAKDDTELRDQVNAAIEKMVDDGSWAEFVEANLGPAGYEAEAAPEITETD